MNGGSYDATARRLLEATLQEDAELRCPDCDVALTRQAVTPDPAVAYVRRRVLVICPSCHRSASLDVKRKHRPQD